MPGAAVGPLAPGLHGDRGAAGGEQRRPGRRRAAHPLAGYAWLAVGFGLYPIARRRAWQAWAVALALGTLFGGVQIARGAHFPSHVLWSAWIVWGVNVALLGDAGPQLAVKPWVPVQDFDVARGELNEAIAAAFRGAGIGAPVPRQEIRLVGGA